MNPTPLSTPQPHKESQVCHKAARCQEAPTCKSHLNKYLKGFSLTVRQELSLNLHSEFQLPVVQDATHTSPLIQLRAGSLPLFLFAVFLMLLLFLFLFRLVCNFLLLFTTVFFLFGLSISVYIRLV